MSDADSRRLVTAVPALAALLWVAALLGTESHPTGVTDDSVTIAMVAWGTTLITAFAAFLAAARTVAHGRRAEPEAWLLATALPWIVALEIGVAVTPWWRPEATALLAATAALVLAAAWIGGGFGIPRGTDPRRFIGVAGVFGAVGVILGLGFAIGWLPTPTPRFDVILRRPWELPALVLLVFAGLIVLPRLHRVRDNLLTFALTASTVPFALGRLTAAYDIGAPRAVALTGLLDLCGSFTLLTALAIDLVRRGRRDHTQTVELETAQRELTRQTEELERVDHELVVQASRRKDAERSLRLLEKAVETMSIGVTIQDGAGLILYVNPAGARMHGYDTDELIGRDAAILRPPQRDRDEPDADVANGQAGPWLREAEHVTRDGTRFPVHLISDAVREGGALAAIVTSCEDITERRRVERMKHDFISTVSHELRTPLTSIIASLGLLDSGALESPHPEAAVADGGVAGENRAQRVELVAVAHRNGKRLLQLINDLLDLQKLSAGKLELELEAVSVGEMLADALSSIEAFADEYEISLRLEPVPPALAARADRRRLTQAVLNLVSNAIKFSPAGETVILNAHPKGDRVVLAVADRGPGIPAAFRPRLFERFSQVDGSATRRAGGSGLGLTIARDLVEAMGGTIAFDTEIGRGTRFFIDLPTA